MQKPLVWKIFILADVFVGYFNHIYNAQGNSSDILNHTRQVTMQV